MPFISDFISTFLQDKFEKNWDTDSSTKRREAAIHCHSVLHVSEGDRSVKDSYNVLCPGSDTSVSLCEPQAAGICLEGFPLNRNTDLSKVSQPDREPLVSDLSTSDGRRGNFSWKAEQQLQSSKAGRNYIQFVITFKNTRIMLERCL